MTLFLISDTHFSHANIIRYANRPFSSPEEMDEELIRRWNSVVRPSDHVYHLGDVAMRRSHLQIIKRLNGHKRLVWGNHDIYDWKSYREVGFEKCVGIRVIDNCILTHIPIHPESLARFTMNIHGHTHTNGSPRGRYLSVCCEMIHYTPISLEEAKKVFAGKPPCEVV